MQLSLFDMHIPPPTPDTVPMPPSPHPVPPPPEVPPEIIDPPLPGEQQPIVDPIPGPTGSSVPAVLV